MRTFQTELASERHVLLWVHFCRCAESNTNDRFGPMDCDQDRGPVYKLYRSALATESLAAFQFFEAFSLTLKDQNDLLGQLVESGAGDLSIEESACKPVC